MTNEIIKLSACIIFLGVGIIIHTCRQYYDDEKRREEIDNINKRLDELESIVQEIKKNIDKNK